MALVTGTSGDDTLVGTEGADTLSGGVSAFPSPFETTGDDSLSGLGGGDTIYGGDGSDTLLGGAGYDFLDGDTGADLLDAGADGAFARGGDGNDTLVGGSSGNEFLSGDAGDDTISTGSGGGTGNGDSGNDVLSGGSGGDSLSGGTGRDSLDGASGNDFLFDTDFGTGDGDADTLRGGTGDDRLTSTGGADLLDGGTGTDTAVLDRSGATAAFVFDASADATFGGATLVSIERVEVRTGSGADTLRGRVASGDALSGGGGDDRLTLVGAIPASGFTSASLSGGDGDDTLEGTAGGLAGGDGADRITLTGTAGTAFGNDGDDVISGADPAAGSFPSFFANLDGGDGDDTITGGTGISGGEGADDITFRAASGTASGGEGDDVVRVTGAAVPPSGPFGPTNLPAGRGDGGDDTLTGAAGGQYLDGGSGDDRLDGRGGDDLLEGGSGDDTAAFSGAASGYAFSRLAPAFAGDRERLVVSGADGTDTLSGVEFLAFGDGTVLDASTLGSVAPPPNRAPVADDEAYSTTRGTPLVLSAADLLVGDTDADGDALTVTGVGGAANGTVSLSGGVATFTPNAGYTGAASFTYTVSDGRGGTDTGLVSIAVNAPPNRAPIADDEALSTAYGAPLAVAASTLLAGDTDADGDALTVASVGSAVGGTVSLSGGTVTFTPTPGFSGPASFQYVASDGRGGADTGLVTVAVGARPAPGAGATSGADVLAGTAGPDLLSGLGGADRLSGGAGDDLLRGDGTAAPAGASAPITAALVASGFARPVFATPVPGDADRMFVVEQQTGRIEVLELTTGTVHARAFLDIPDAEMGRAGEQGLLGLAFDPAYEANGRFYVYLINAAGTGELRRYERSASDPLLADAASGDVILTVPQPTTQHKSGWMAFGPDGFLYLTTGDGSAGGDPGNNAQNADSLLGKVLRIDVRSDAFPSDPLRDYAIPAGNPFAGAAAGADEVWALGLRNPWRNAFDPITGDLWLADVGQSRREEVNFQPGGAAGGANYGWKRFEGTTTYAPDAPLGPGTPTGPLHEYAHPAAGGGFSVTGGLPYRGASSAFDGQYLFSDFVAAQLWTLPAGGTSGASTNRTPAVTVSGGDLDGVVAFAEDAAGNAYVIGFDGDVHRLDLPADPEAGAGNDTLSGGDGDDRVFAGGGNDDASGDGGDDMLSGGAGDDALRGGEGHDTLFGGAGADTLAGGAGADALSGGAGNDALDGGEGRDTASFSGAASGYAFSRLAPATAGGPERLVVSGADGTDTLAGVEFLSFGDGTTRDAATLAANRAPVADDEAFSTPFGTALTIPVATLLAGDTDPDGDALSVASVGPAVGGTVFLSGGVVTFVPAAGFSGAASFEYRLSDGRGGSDAGAVSVSVGPRPNRAPVADDEAFSTAFGTALTIPVSTLLAGDTDADGDTLAVTSVFGATNGTVSLSGGVVSFAPAFGFSGAASFSYFVSDGRGLADVGAVSVSVARPAGANRAPVADDETFSTAPGTTLRIPVADLLAGDTDADGDALRVVSVSSGPGGFASLSDGTVSYFPSGSGGSGSFTYVVSDGRGGTDTGLATVVVNRAPVADDELAITFRDTPVSVFLPNLLAGDVDPDGQALSVTSVGGAVNGTVTIRGSSAVFTPTPGFVGAASFEYTVSDPFGASDAGTVSVAVRPTPNRAPVAAPDVFTAVAGTPLRIAAADILGNDRDADGDALSLVRIGGLAGSGTAVLSGDAVLVTSDARAVGAVTFNYAARDAAGAEGFGSVKVVLAPAGAPNAAPVADAEGFATSAGVPLRIAVADLLAGDTDPDGDALTVSAVGGAVGGTVSLSGGFATFTPTAGFEGFGGFRYTVSDGRGGTDTAPVAVAVSRAPAPPAPKVSTGTEGPDSLVGTAGADVLRGLGGADTLDGGAGADTMEGGAGDDLYIVRDAGDVVVEALGGGDDRVYALADLTLGAGVERLTIGRAGLTATGNALPNIVDGSPGADRVLGGGGGDAIRGKAGDDTLDGGAGSDQLEGGAGRDQFVFRASDGAGDERVFDFDADGDDLLVLVGFGAAYDTPGEVLATASFVSTREGFGVALGLGPDVRIVLVGTGASALGADDLVLV